MPWSQLPTNYADSVWVGKKKYARVENSDGTVSFRDLTSYYIKENGFLTADEVNRICAAINELMESTRGITPVIIVQTNEGATVSVSDGTETQTVIAEDGRASFNIADYGDYTVSDGTNTETVTVDTVKIYPVDFTS